MATKQILEVARSFKTIAPAIGEEHASERRYLRWPIWPSKLSLPPKDKYLIEIRPRRRPSV